jgi:hypothetical protein
MMRRKLFRIGAFLVCAALLVAGLGFRYSIMDSVLVMPVREATWFYKALATVNPDFGPAWNGLGVTHVAAYALDVDAVAISFAYQSFTKNWLHPSNIEIPPQVLARRLPELPPHRLLHLAKAVRAFGTASRLDGESRYSGLLGLGYTLYECRDRFNSAPWPLHGDDFDDAVRQHAGDPRWWEDQALAALRAVSERDMSGEYVLQDIRNVERQTADALKVQILSERELQTDSESQELASLLDTPYDSGPWWEFSASLDGGLPPQPEAFEALYPVTQEGLATADLYLRAVDAAARVFPAYRDLPIVGDYSEVRYVGRSIKVYERLRIAQYLKGNAKAFSLVREASAARVCRYPLDFSETGWGDTHGHRGGLSRLLESLAVKVLYEAEIGDSDATTAALLDCFALAESLRMEPLELSQSTRLLMISRTLDALEDAQIRVAFSPAQLTRLQSQLRSLEGIEPNVNGYIGSEILVQRYVDQVQSEDSFGEPEFSALMARLDTPSAEAFHSAVHILVDAIPRPYAEAVVTYQGVHAKFPDFHWAYPRSLNWIVRTQASLRNAQVGLALGRYALAHASLPDSLEALVPDYLDRVPLDPFDAQPLRYRRVGEGFVVYAVGENMVDDGGVRKVKNEYGQLRRADELYCIGVPEAAVAGMTEEERDASREKPVVRGSVPQGGNRGQLGEAFQGRGGGLGGLGAAEDTGAGRRPAPTKEIAE